MLPNVEMKEKQLNMNIAPPVSLFRLINIHTAICTVYVSIIGVVYNIRHNLSFTLWLFLYFYPFLSTELVQINYSHADRRY